MSMEDRIDFDCEFYLQKVVEEGMLDADRRTTNSVVYHLCTYFGKDTRRRCNLDACPKREAKREEEEA